MPFELRPLSFARFDTFIEVRPLAVLTINGTSPAGTGTRANAGQVPKVEFCGTTPQDW